MIKAILMGLGIAYVLLWCWTVAKYHQRCLGYPEAMCLLGAALAYCLIVSWATV